MKLFLMKKIKLYKRYCQCGCGYSFHVYPKDSPCWFKNYYHAKYAKKLIGKPKILAEKFFMFRAEILKGKSSQGKFNERMKRMAFREVSSE